MKRFSFVVDSDRRQSAYENARKVFQGQLFGNLNNDVGSALDIAFDAFCAALDIELIEPGEMSYTPEKAATVRLVINLLSKEYDEWQRCNLEVWNKRGRDDIEGEHPYDLRHAVYQEIHRAFESIGLEVFPRSASVAHRDPAPLAHLLPRKPWKTQNEAIAWARAILETSAGKKKRASKAVAKSKPAKRKRAAKALAAPVVALNGKGHINGLANGATAHA